MELEPKQKQEYHHHRHRPMYKAESAWDLDVEKIHVPLTSGTVPYIPGMEQDYIISSLMPTSCEQAKNLDTALGGKTRM